MQTDPTRQPVIVSVRSLVEFVLQSGDLTAGGFHRRDRAQLGTRGHQRVQRSRPEGYEAEVEIAYRVEGADPPMEVRGRIDGLYTDKVPVILEEIKTTTLSLDLVDSAHNPLHWAQAQCYAYMYAQKQGLREVSIHLTYFHMEVSPQLDVVKLPIVEPVEAQQAKVDRAVWAAPNEVAEI